MGRKGGRKQERKERREGGREEKYSKGVPNSPFSENKQVGLV